MNNLAELKEQALINVSVKLVKFLKLVFHPNEKEYQNLKVLIEELMSIPGMELPAETTMYDEAWKEQEDKFKR